MIYEIRDYHFRPDLINEYRQWAEAAVPVLRANIDLVGFYIDTGAEAPEQGGTEPMDSPIGHANITWIIRWENKSARDKLLPAAIASEEWQAVWARNPDPGGYRQMLSRFTVAM